MKEKFKHMMRRATRAHTAEYLLKRLMTFFVRYNPALLPQIKDGLQFPLVVSESTAQMLDEIPSETTSNERRFLYRFFSTIWSGKNNVIEIGPFLGGTSRAIALGMCENPRVSAKAKLFTFDRFYGYYDLQQLTGYLKPLVRADVLQQSDISDLGDSADFMDIFVKIHANHDYYRRIVPGNKAVPDSPQDLGDTKLFLTIPENVLTDAVFIDGCKSWFGTKYFMREVCKVAKKGAYFIFQDYGWYTCFWIPAFVALLRDYFQIIGYVDTTYVFILNKPLSIETIDLHYPDRPSDLNEERLVEVFDQCIQDAFYRNDHSAAVGHTLQKAGALAYVGNRIRAKEVITAIRRKPWATGHHKIIEAALRSPTYSPEGPILLK